MCEDVKAIRGSLLDQDKCCGLTTSCRKRPNFGENLGVLELELELDGSPIVSKILAHVFAAARAVVGG